MSSFYHLNRYIFDYAFDGKANDWINKAFSSYKSGVINPSVDKNWKEKVDKYLDYIRAKRNKYKNWYIEVPRKK